MPRWPLGYKARQYLVCPQCGGKKAQEARTCRSCQPKYTPLIGRKGSAHPAWKGGRMVDRDGYIRAYVPGYVFARKGPYVLEHVMVMELSLGRQIQNIECVHHLDGNRQNNGLENLQLMTKSAHSKLHRANDCHLRKRNGGRFA